MKEGTSKFLVSIFVLLIAFSVVVAPFLLVNKVNAQEENSWTSMESMPTARCGFGVAVIDGKIYVIGGSNGNNLGTNQMYDSETDTWTTKKPMPTPRNGGAIAVYQNKIYVLGGTIGLPNIPPNFTGANEVYDPLTDTWENKTELPKPRAGFRANVVNDQIYLISGLENPFSPFSNSDETLVYFPLNDSWTTKAPIPTPVSSYASAVADKKIYILGGRDSSLNIMYNLTQIYDTETDTWSYGVSIPTNLSYAAAGATTGEMASTRIYVLGGFTSFDYEAVSLNYVYDPVGDVWSMGTSMPTPRYSLGVAVINDTLYAIGGRPNTDNFLAVNEKYTPIGYIPEFPSWTPLLVMLLVAVVAVIVTYRFRLAKNKGGADK
jgi:energy-converting hydrogenase Eha subunit A